MQEELAALVGRNVDLNTPQCLSRYFREEVLAKEVARLVAEGIVNPPIFRTSATTWHREKN